MISQHQSRRFGAAMAVVVATLLSAATLAAHDFWLVPNALAFATGAPIEVLGQSGSRFPTSGGATQPEQVADARIIGRTSSEKIGDLSVSGRSLLLRHKPSAAGQYVVAVALASRSTRTTPARLQRYVSLEGAPELATCLELEGRLPKVDSLTQVSAKFAKTITQVGAKGARAFDKAAGYTLELVPLDDPSTVRIGQWVRVRLLFHGTPLANVHLRAGWGSPDLVMAEAPASGAESSPPEQVVMTDADGIATVAISHAGLWNVRTLYAAAMQGMPEHWEVFFSTLVFSVGSGSAGGAR